MKKTQRLLCLLTTLILLLAQLPALADGYVPLTQQEIAQARQLIAMEGDIQGWEKGMTPSASMNALQIQQYLEWLLSDEVGGLLVRIRDKAELLGNQSLEGVEDLLRQFRDQLDHYRDRLETGRLTVFNSLHQLEADAELTQREKRRLTDKVREYVAEMQTIIGTVVRYYQQYEEAVDSHELNFLNVLQAADTPDGAITQQAEEKLLAEAEALTNEEQAHIDGRNSVDFSVVTLSTKQFGFIIRDHEGKLLKDAQVSVQATGYPRSLKTVTTGENGLASFLVADFVPTSNRRVTLDVVVTHSQHNTREMRRLTLRGGQAEIVRLEKYTGVPYLRMACYNGSDIVVQQNTIYYTAKNDAQQTIDVMLENPGKQVLTGTLYLVYQTYDEDGSLKETEESRKLTTGEAVTFTGEYCRLIAPGSTVSIRAEIPSKSYNRTFQTQLKIEKAYVEEPVFNNDQFISFTPGGLSFQFPADTPFVGDLQMNLSLPFIQSQMVIDPSGYIQYAYGKTFESEELSWKQESLKDKTERMDEAAREGERDANAVNNQVYQNQGASKPAKFLGNIKAMLTPFAALQGRITEVTTSEGLKEKVGLKGNAGVQMAFKGGYTYPFMIWAIPCFCAMDFTFSLGTAFSIGLTADWPSMSNMALDFGTGVTIAILAELGVSGGVGVKDFFSLAVRFYGNIKPLLRLGKSSGASVTLGFGLEVTAQMILLKLKRTLWKGSWSSSSNGTSALNAANGAENGEVSLTALSAGVNIPEKKQLPPAGTGKTGVFPTSEEQLFKQTDALAQEIQYVTLQSGSEKATFGLWITPTGQATGRQAKLIWYNLDDSSRHGEIYPSMGGDAQRSASGTASDYAFAIRSHQDMVAVNVLSGVFTEGQDHPSKSTMTLAVLQLQNGSLVMKKYAPHVTETPNAARYLSSPIVYFVRHNSATAVCRACLVPERFLRPGGHQERRDHGRPFRGSGSDLRRLCRHLRPHARRHRKRAGRAPDDLRHSHQRHLHRRLYYRLQWLQPQPFLLLLAERKTAAFRPSEQDQTGTGRPRGLHGKHGGICRERCAGVRFLPEGRLRGGRLGVLPADGRDPSGKQGIYRAGLRRVPVRPAFPDRPRERRLPVRHSLLVLDGKHRPRPRQRRSGRTLPRQVRALRPGDQHHERALYAGGAVPLPGQHSPAAGRYRLLHHRSGTGPNAE